jgi:hypothetical protein
MDIKEVTGMTWTASSALQARRPIDIPEYQADEPSFDADTLAHHGVKGQKKGVRQYQYPDGTYTPLGREHYGIGKGRDGDKLTKEQKKTAKEQKKVAKYQKKESVRVDRKYARRLKRNDEYVTKLKEKYEKLFDKGASDFRLKRIGKKYERAAARKYFEESMKSAEMKSIAKADLKSIKKERRKVLLEYLLIGGLGAQNKGASGDYIRQKISSKMTGLSYDWHYSNSALSTAKTNARVSGKEKRELSANAHSKAAKDLERLRKKRQ